MFCKYSFFKIFCKARRLSTLAVAKSCIVINLILILSYLIFGRKVDSKTPKIFSKPAYWSEAMFTNFICHPNPMHIVAHKQVGNLSEHARINKRITFAGHMRGNFLNISHFTLYIYLVNSTSTFSSLKFSISRYIYSHKQYA